MSTISKNSKIYVAGHRGLVGSAILRELTRQSYNNTVVRTHAELELRDKKAVREFMEQEKPEVVILAAARVGGIGANSRYPVEFLLENLEIQNNVISTSAAVGVEKLIFLGSSCIYPKDASYPLTEDQLLTKPFEPTNEAYALAKVAGIKLCEYYARQYGKKFVSLMPTNLYGPNDYYDFEKSHVIPAMMLKVLNAKMAGKKEVVLWGTGKPLREFLYSDDLARAVVLCMEKYEGTQLLNIGSEKETSIAELASIIVEVCDYKGLIRWDTSKPDGIYRKVMDSSRIQQLGWRPQISLEEGLKTIVPEAQKKLENL